MGFQNLSSTVSGAIQTITVTRPEKLNALNRETIRELGIAFDQARENESVRVVVLAGAGEKAFVAGADISELNTATAVQAQRTAQEGQRMMRGIERLGKPVIARLQGFALGGGLELAMACHLRIANENAKLGLPEIGLGLMPGFGGTQRIVRLVGRSAALEMALSGKPIDAQRAFALGLVNRVVAIDELDAEVDRWANQFASAAPHAVAGILSAVLAADDLGIDDGLDYEARAFGLLFSTADMKEGTAAFLERRKPTFTGN